MNAVALYLQDECGTGGAFVQRARQYGIEHDAQSVLALVQTPQRLVLRKRDEPKLGDVYVDFVSGALAHRRRYGGGRGEAIVRAAGVKGNYLPEVIDATAGLGRDAFVLAAAGCRVRMLERHPVVAMLLEDGLRRGYADQEIGAWLPQRLTLLPQRSLTDLPAALTRPDVIYLDPMYPHRPGTAQVKKEMRLLQLLVGTDEDAAELLTAVRRLAQKRVVVKRPDYAPSLDEAPAPAHIALKNHRFELYPPLTAPAAFT